MYSLEEQIRQTGDPNRKARKMIRYATGMTHSYTDCWSLTRYSRSYFEPERICIKQKTIQEESDRMIQEALSLFTDKEALAHAYWHLGYYRKVVRDFPNTGMAYYARTHCDNLRDYFGY